MEGGMDRPEGLLMGLLLCLTKVAINRSRQQGMETVIIDDCLLLFHGYIHIWASTEEGGLQKGDDETPEAVVPVHMNGKAG
eukprot:g36659.t1